MCHYKKCAANHRPDEIPKHPITKYSNSCAKCIQHFGQPQYHVSESESFLFPIKARLAITRTTRRDFRQTKKV